MFDRLLPSRAVRVARQQHVAQTESVLLSTPTVASFTVLRPAETSRKRAVASTAMTSLRSRWDNAQAKQRSGPDNYFNRYVMGPSSCDRDMPSYGQT